MWCCCRRCCCRRCKSSIQDEYSNNFDHRSFTLYASNIKQDVKANSSIVPPSEAPDPSARNGYRRSKFNPRFDPNGYHIEELSFLEGHLPNSAWAMRESLMPLKRKMEFIEFMMNRGIDMDGFEERIRADEEMAHAQEAAAQAAEQPHGEEEADSLKPRFWKLLTSPIRPKSSLSLENVSLAPIDAEHNDDDYVEEEMQLATNARDFTFLTWWESEIASSNRNTTKLADYQYTLDGCSHSISPKETSMEYFLATSPKEANSVLLRVLKHSMSELQRDFKLARSVLLLIADLHLIDDSNCNTLLQPESSTGLEVLRRMLIIISSEYIYCNGLCHETYLANGGVDHFAVAQDNDDEASHNVEEDESVDLEETSNEDNEEWEDHHRNTAAVLNDSRLAESPTHYCQDWYQFLGSLSTCIAHGIQYMTRQHASIICAFVLREIDQLVGAFMADIDKTIPGGKSSDNVDLKKTDNASYKGLLKANLFMLNSEGEEYNKNPCRQLRVNLLVALVNGLKRHALLNKKFLEKHPRGSDEKNQTLGKQQSLDSFRICVEAIVDIGERILLKLPTNNCSSLLGGFVIRALLEVHLESDVMDSIDEDQLYLGRHPRLRSLIDPMRYADAVSNSWTNPHLDTCMKRKSNGSDMMLDIISKPSKDVQDAVRGLFIRDLVDLRISGFGYGDFIVWFGIPVCPSEIDLFMYYRNFPSLNEHASEVWALNEEGDALSYTGLASRYDFSLMLLLREWNAPWTSSSHMSYSFSFRRAVKESALCAHRFGVPSDIVVAVNSFLPRSWWPDERASCWCRDCQLVSLKEQFKEKVMNRRSNWSEYDNIEGGKQKTTAARAKAPSLISCKCNVALACSKDHMKYLHQEGHKRCCGLPPFRILTEEDHAFIRDVFGDELRDTETAYEEEDGDDDEDEDWESIDSNDLLNDGRTRSEKILKYFEGNSYRHTRREVLPFEDFF